MTWWHKNINISWWDQCNWCFIFRIRYKPGVQFPWEPCTMQHSTVQCIKCKNETTNIFSLDWLTIIHHRSIQYNRNPLPSIINLYCCTALYCTVPFSPCVTDLKWKLKWGKIYFHVNVKCIFSIFRENN